MHALEKKTNKTSGAPHALEKKETNIEDTACMLWKKQTFFLVKVHELAMQQHFFFALFLLCLFAFADSKNRITR